jgi:hypothetical protein
MKFLHNVIGYSSLLFDVKLFLVLPLPSDQHRRLILQVFLTTLLLVSNFLVLPPSTDQHRHFIPQVFLTTLHFGVKLFLVLPLPTAQYRNLILQVFLTTSLGACRFGT